MSGAVDIESAMELSSLILPQDGEIVLDNALISLGIDETEKNCTKGNSYYLDKSAASWLQAGVWISDKFTDATPDTEKIPCQDDVVEFPVNAKYIVQLPNQQQTIRGLKIGNSSFSTDTFRSRIMSQTSEMQQFQLNKFMDLGVVIAEPSCQNKFGCPCQNTLPRIDCAVKFCPKPTCVAPVKSFPTYCCPFCGGHIKFDVDAGFDMMSFKELVNKVVDGYGDSLVYHIGFAATEPNYKVQLVIMDKGVYNGNSAEAVNAISNGMFSHWYKGEKLFQISGTPLSKRGLGAKIFVSMFFTVALVMGAIYLYYYKLPTVRFPVAGASGAGMFSRFQNRSDSVVSLTRRDSTVAPLPRTAFKNPLYDSKRGRVQVVETPVEE